MVTANLAMRRSEEQDVAPADSHKYSPPVLPLASVMLYFQLNAEVACILFNSDPSTVILSTAKSLGGG